MESLIVWLFSIQGPLLKQEVLIARLVRTTEEEYGRMPQVSQLVLLWLDSRHFLGTHDIECIESLQSKLGSHPKLAFETSVSTLHLECGMHVQKEGPTISGALLVSQSLPTSVLIS